MGCDIESWVDRREDGKWKRTDVELPDIRRSDLFWFIGGVEMRPPADYEHAPFAHRGLPPDINPKTWEAESRDLFCYSWATLAEMVGVTWPEDARGEFYDALLSLVDDQSQTGVSPDDIRVVYAFNA